MIRRVVPGFLMGELLITILIMAILAFIFAGYYTKTCFIQRDTRLYLQATTIASSAMEKVLSEKKVPTSSQTIDNSFTLTWRSAHMPETSTHLPFEQVEVNVSWQSPLRVMRTITLRSGFVSVVGAT